MRRTDTWKTEDLIIGSPAYRMSISDTTDEHLENKGLENPEDGWVLTNQIVLSYKQGEEFLEFLVAEEHTLILIAADEDRDVRETYAMIVDTYAMIVDILLERRREKRELKEGGMKENQLKRKSFLLQYQKVSISPYPKWQRPVMFQ